MRRAPFLLCLLAPLAACKGEETGDSDDPIDTDEQTGPLVFEDFVNVTEEAVGDFTCHPGGEPWMSQTVATDLQVVTSVPLAVLDFESESPVPDASVTLWYGDDVEATPDTTGVSDNNGLISLDLPTCTAISYKTGTDPELNATRDTYEAHQIVPANPTEAVGFNSVSNATYQIIPGILGVSPTPGLGIIAGTAFDCAGGDAEKAQVVVRGADGSIPQSLIVKYFVDRFPNRDQPHTSPDGLWVAVNVPPGEWTVEMWAMRGGTLTLTGATIVQSYADSINISNIHAGYGDGVKYPPECLSEG